MAMPNYLPSLSAYAPVGASEGSIDPFGLQNAAGRLADLLLPGLTVRVERARCITLSVLAVELANDPALSSEFDNPWKAILAFERLCLYALVKQVDQTTNPIVRGFPGRLKAKKADQQKQPLTLSSYVKGPATNGLVGIHFRTARTAYLFNDDYRVLARGERLLRAWEQGVGTDEWNTLRKKILGLLQREMQSQAGVPATWAGYEELAEVCRLDKLKLAERQVLMEALCDSESGLQPTTLGRLQMADCKAAYAAPAAGGDDDDLADSQTRGGVEREIMLCLAKRPVAELPQGAALQAVAQAVLAYEEVAGYLTLAFDLLRAYAHSHRLFRLTEVSSDPALAPNWDDYAANLARALPILRAKLQALCTMVIPQARLNRGADELWQTVEPMLNELQSGLQVPQLLEWIVQHHQQVQAAKSKQPWLVQDGIGPYRFFPEYTLEAQPERTPAFLFAYRLLNAYTLLNDLKLLN